MHCETAQGVETSGAVLSAARWHRGAGRGQRQLETGTGCCFIGFEKCYRESNPNRTDKLQAVRRLAAEFAKAEPLSSEQVAAPPLV